jgi:DMSO/TMAO reductase YedYZ molybdopterin-dependent catalytic subunit
MNPTPSHPPLLDDTCNRVVAALTRRLSAAAQAAQLPPPAAHHDFLVPVMHPELAENGQHLPGAE